MTVISRVSTAIIAVAALWTGIGRPAVADGYQEQRFDQCGHRAIDYIGEQMGQQLKDSGDAHYHYGYVQNYNYKMDKCFVLVTVTVRFGGVSSQTKHLVEVNEGRDYAVYAERKVSGEITECFVNGARCSSLGDWEKSVEPYTRQN